MKIFIVLCVVGVSFGAPSSQSDESFESHDDAWKFPRFEGDSSSFESSEIALAGDDDWRYV